MRINKICDRWKFYDWRKVITNFIFYKKMQFDTKL